jgi:hypothetical protein
MRAFTSDQRELPVRLEAGQANADEPERPGTIVEGAVE